MTETKEEPSLGRSIAVGASWLAVLRLGSKLLDVISLAILARLLAPGDFGVVAIGTSIASGIGLLQATSFGAALIQNQSATRAHYNSAWSVQVCLSTVVACLLLLSAAPASGYFSEPALEVVISVAALAMFIDGWGNIAVIDFQKDMRFDKEVALRFSRLIITKLTVVGVAFYFRNYQALVVGMIVSSIVGIVLGYMMKPFRPRFTFSKAGELFKFSAWMQLTNVLAFVNGNLQNFVIGAYHGVREVGLFNMSGQIATLTGATIQGPISQASYPAFAKTAHDPEALLDQYLAVLGYTTLLALPSSIGIALTASHTIPLFLGAKWTAAIPVIQILAIGSAARAMIATSNPVFMALNKPSIVTYLAAGRMVVLIPGMFIGTSLYGLTGAAWAVALVPVIFFPIRQGIMARTLKVSPLRILLALLRPVAATTVMATSVWQIDQLLTFEESAVGHLLSLVVLMAAGGIIFCGAVVTMWYLTGKPDGPERKLMNIIRARIRRLTRP